MHERKKKPTSKVNQARNKSFTDQKRKEAEMKHKTTGGF